MKASAICPHSLDRQLYSMRLTLTDYSLSFVDPATFRSGTKHILTGVLALEPAPYSDKFYLLNKEKNKELAKPVFALLSVFFC